MQGSGHMQNVGQSVTRTHGVLCTQFLCDPMSVPPINRNNSQDTIRQIALEICKHGGCLSFEKAFARIPLV